MNRNDYEQLHSLDELLREVRKLKDHLDSHAAANELRRVAARTEDRIHREMLRLRRLEDEIEYKSKRARADIAAAVALAIVAGALWLSLGIVAVSALANGCLSR